MKWSWRIATVRGIDIKVHVTFALALLWGAYLWHDGTWLSALYGVFLTLLLFVVVVLHELGHGFMAQRYGIEVYDIILLPIGGVARLSHMPQRPSQELAVALAGPAVNLALAVLLAPFVVGGMIWRAGLTGDLFWPPVTVPGLLNVAAFMVMVNISLLVFNMLPAFPMDGGRVLRALMAMRWTHRRATQVAVMVGRIFAVLFGVLAIYTANIFMGVVAVFVFAGAGAEGRSEDEEPESAGRSLVGDYPASRPPVLLSDTPAYLAFERLMRSPYPALAVVNQRGDLVGLITRTGMQSRWAAGVRGPVSSFVEPPMSLTQSTIRLE